MPKTFEELLADLHSPHPWVREAAALALGESCDPRAPDAAWSGAWSAGEGASA